MISNNCPCETCTADQQSMRKQPEIVAPVRLRLMLWNEPCRAKGCLVQTHYRDEDNQPLCLGCARVRAAWDTLQAVPAYVERRQEA